MSAEVSLLSFFKSQHTVKLYICGGISKHGAINVVVFDGTMDGPRYTQIMTAGLLFLSEENSPMDGLDSSRIMTLNIPVVLQKLSLRTKV